MLPKVIESFIEDERQHLRQQYEDEAMNWRRKSEDMAQNASEKFQNLVDEVMRDGVIDHAEAVALVQVHNKLQEESRQALREKLAHYGQGRIGERVETGYVIPPRPEPNVDHMFSGGVGLRPEINLKPKTRQRLIWLSIMVPAIIACIIKLLGA